MRISDSIESYIKDLLTEDSSQIELKRNELAEYFGCAPSQINYVLTTRFSPDSGYLIESRRGGGGCIRIMRVVRSGSRQLLYLINERIGTAITEMEAVRILTQLQEQNVLTQHEAQIMASAVNAQALAVPVPEPVKDAFRARILKSMLTTVVAQNRS